MLVVSYGTRDLAHRCTKLELAQAWLGATDAQALIDLIAEIESFENAAELLEFRDGQVGEGDSLRVDFSPRYRALLIPVGKNIPRAKDGCLALEEIHRLLLSDIVEV
jgi:hypothetical protein